MERQPKALNDAWQLLQLAELVSSQARIVIEEWASETDVDTGKAHSSRTIPSRRLYEAQRKILAATGSLTELVAEPSLRILELACQYWETRALYIAAERRIPDILAAAGDVGVSCETLSERTGIECMKLSRILRCLCSNHVFREVKPYIFANNVISSALVQNEPLRAYIMNFNLDLYAASEHMPHALLDPQLGKSYKVDETAFQLAIGTSKSRWDWLEETVDLEHDPNPGAPYPSVPQVPQQKNMLKSQTDSHINGNGVLNNQTNGDGVNNGANGQDLGVVNGTGECATKRQKRPEHHIFNLAMLGGGRVHGAAHPHDFPWGSLGEAVVVDVGGGVGGFDIQLSHLYPELRFVIQDCAGVVKKARETVWPKENPSAVAANRVEFMEHDMFNVNPVRDADVYWLRSILHDWSDTYCVDILSAIRRAISDGSKSRILICDQLMTPTIGAPELEPAPAPLLGNYGYATRFSHQRDLCMMGIINGIERTPDQLRDIVEKAGLRVEKVWDCRSQVPIVELRVAPSST